MFSIKRFVGFATGLLLLGSLATPAVASALTSSQISAIISLLQSFGADQSVINNVSANLTGTTSPTDLRPVVPFDTFTANPASGPSPLLVNFTSSPATSPIDLASSYTVSFGDGNSTTTRALPGFDGTRVRVSHTYGSVSGTFPVTLLQNISSSATGSPSTVAPRVVATTSVSVRLGAPSITINNAPAFSVNYPYPAVGGTSVNVLAHVAITIASLDQPGPIAYSIQPAAILGDGKGSWEMTLNGNNFISAPGGPFAFDGSLPKGVYEIKAYAGSVAGTDPLAKVTLTQMGGTAAIDAASLVATSTPIKISGTASGLNGVSVFISSYDYGSAPSYDTMAGQIGKDGIYMLSGTMGTDAYTSGHWSVSFSQKFTNGTVYVWVYDKAAHTFLVKQSIIVNVPWTTYTGPTTITASVTPPVEVNRTDKLQFKWDIGNAPSGAKLEIGVTGIPNPIPDPSYHLWNIAGATPLQDTSRTFELLGDRGPFPTHGTAGFVTGYGSDVLPISGTVNFTVLDANGNVLAQANPPIWIFNVVPTATIDQSSLSAIAAAGNPTITGTAKNISAVTVTINSKKYTVLVSGGTNAATGTWRVVYDGAPLPAGSSVPVTVTTDTNGAPASPLTLATGTLVVRAPDPQPQPSTQMSADIQVGPPGPCQIAAGATTCPVTVRWSTQNAWYSVLQAAGGQFGAGQNLIPATPDSSGTVTYNLAPGGYVFAVASAPTGGGYQTVKQVAYYVQGAPTQSNQMSADIQVSPPGPCQIAAGATTCPVTVRWTTQNAWYSVLQAAGGQFGSGQNLIQPTPDASGVASYNLTPGGYIFAVASAPAGGGYQTTKQVAYYVQAAPSSFLSQQNQLAGIAAAFAPHVDPTLTPAAPTVPPAPPTLTTAFSRTLDKGAEGSDVLALQTKLQGLGFFEATPNGYYGPNTEQAVRLYQAAHGLTQTGTVGPYTLAELNK